MNRGFAVSILFAVITLAATIAKGQLSLTNSSNSATIDFSSSTPASVGTSPGSAYAGGGFESNPSTAGRLNSNAWAVTGWSAGSLAYGGTQTTSLTDYRRGAVSTAQFTGGFYAYTGSGASASNPIFLIQPNGSSFAPGTLTLRIVNNGTKRISDLDVAYDLYVRNDQTRGNYFNFSYSTDDVTYTPISSLNYLSPAGTDALGLVLVGGTSPSRSTTITGLSVLPNAYIYLRWFSNDSTGSGSRDEFGLDNIAVTATYSTALPIKLLSFDGTQKPGGVTLEWTSSCESAMSVYELEKSADGVAFTKIATIAAQNSDCSGDATYSYNDASVLGNAAYRLKMREINGDSSYSAVRYFYNSRAQGVNVWPNPAVDKLHVSGLHIGTQWTITDSYGRVLRSGVAAKDATDILVGNLAPGMYFLHTAGGQVIYFLKQ